MIAGIVLALLFNFVNGMNDATNSIATVVATRVLTPLRAVPMAAFFNMVGPLLLPPQWPRPSEKELSIPCT